jgi:hypothetical protein
MSHSTGHCSGVQRGVDKTVKVKLPLARDFRRLRQFRAGPINLLRRAGNFGKLWSACWQHGIQNTEKRMNK